MRVARHILTLGPNCPFRLAAYHAQQCSEKCLKGYLVSRKVDFPYTHDISNLLELCQKYADWPQALVEAAKLTAYSSTARYPALDLEVTHDEALHAIELAEKVRRVVSEALRQEGWIPPETSGKPEK